MPLLASPQGSINVNLRMGDAIMDQRQAKLLLPENAIELVIVTRFNIQLCR